MSSFSATPDMLVARADGLPFSRVDDSVIAIDRVSGYCFAMNVTSARVWELMAAPIRIDSLCDALCREFEVDPGHCMSDLISILSEMRENGLLREAAPTR